MDCVLHFPKVRKQEIRWEIYQFPQSPLHFETACPLPSNLEWPRTNNQNDIWAQVYVDLTEIETTQKDIPMQKQNLTYRKMTMVIQGHVLWGQWKGDDMN